ncbi:hypothetical protein HYN46_01545 [Aquirhabdus parva]|uniref:Uncharacterized protein n=1 Tax=Aquirhabdus parva TaxID=2283318 RepID=A0A345P329_9GAMM|nr:hypothetical protein HYN46_01545 [Aquirhabdus parva]
MGIFTNILYQFMSFSVLICHSSFCNVFGKIFKKRELFNIFVVELISSIFVMLFMYNVKRFESNQLKIP